MEPKRPGAPIDPYSEYDLYDVLEGEIPSGESTEYEGLHLISGGSSITVQPDGHVGSVGTIHPDGHDDVLEIVNKQNSYVQMWNELEEDELLDWAGPLATTDESKQDDDRYVVVPEDPPSV